jgi:hypothetical protein
MSEAMKGSAAATWLGPAPGLLGDRGERGEPGLLRRLRRGRGELGIPSPLWPPAWHVLAE